MRSQFCAASPIWFCDVQVGNAALSEFFCQIQRNRFCFCIVDAVCDKVGRHPNTDTVSTDLCNGCVHSFKCQASTIFKAATISVCTHIAVGGHKLLQQI